MSDSRKLAFFKNVAWIINPEQYYGWEGCRAIYAISLYTRKGDKKTRIYEIVEEAAILRPIHSGGGSKTLSWI